MAWYRAREQLCPFSLTVTNSLNKPLPPPPALLWAGTIFGQQRLILFAVLRESRGSPRVGMGIPLGREWREGAGGCCSPGGNNLPQTGQHTSNSPVLRLSCLRPAAFPQHPFKLVIFNFCVIFGCQPAGTKEGVSINFQATMRLEGPFKEQEMWPGLEAGWHPGSACAPGQQGCHPWVSQPGCHLPQPRGGPQGTWTRTNSSGHVQPSTPQV